MSKDKILKCEPAKIKITMGSVSFKHESNHVLTSRRQLCKDFLSKREDLSESDILEFLLALHFVLEIGINTFFRNYYSTYTNQNPLKYENELDEINYIDKIRFFINSNNFIYKDGNDVQISKEKAKRLISDMKSFGRIRNMIIHGHSVSEVTGEINKKSKLKDKLSPDSLIKQKTLFKNILENINFFVEKLETHIGREQIKVFQNSFLNADFL